MRPFPLWLRLWTLFVCVLLTIVAIATAMEVGFWAAVISILAMGIAGGTNYLLGWYAYERRLHIRDPLVEELRGRDPRDPTQEGPVL